VLQWFRIWFHSILPNSETSLCSHLHLIMHQLTMCTRSLFYFPLAAPATVHACCRHNRHDISSPAISHSSFVPPHTTPLCAIRSHVAHSLLTTHSLSIISFQHAPLGSFRQSRRRTRSHRGARHSARLSPLCLRRIRRVWKIGSFCVASTNPDSILFGYDSGYISGVLAMNQFKQQFGSK
jgi:hypothetical protein